MSTVDKIAGIDRRIGTGPIQFGSDWPGVFIRGDEASNYALAVKYAIDKLKQDDRSVLHGLYSLLMSSQVKNP